MPAPPRVYLYFFITIALLAAGLVVVWSSLSSGVAVAALAILAVGSCVGFWRVRESRKGLIR